MIRSSVFKQFNITVVDLTDVLKYIEVDLINDLCRYQLLKKSRLTKDVKKLLYHHVFFGLCEYILNAHNTGKVFFVIKNNESFQSLQIIKYFKQREVERCMTQVLTRAARLLPISIYSCDSSISISEFEEEYAKGSGEIKEFMERIKSFHMSQDFIKSHFTFAKVKLFARRNELTFLNEKYFNRFKTRQLLMM